MITTIKYPETFSPITKQVDVSKSYTSIGECLSLLLTSTKGEFFGDPNYGTRLYEYVYEHNTGLLEELVRDEICEAIKIYEPRITVTENDVIITQEDNTVNVKINYYMKDEGTYMSYSIAMIKEETNNEY